MRHKKKKTRLLEVGVQRKDNVIRNYLTSLVLAGQIQTTSKRAKVIKAEADKLFARFAGLSNKYDEKGVLREAIRIAKAVFYDDKAGKKVVREFMPRWKNDARTTGFIADYKLGMRKGDNAEKVLVKIL